MEVIVGKNSPSKIDHHSRNPNREKWHKAAERRIAKGKLKFENDAERRDYEKAVKSNSNNVMGLPTFFPPAQMPVVAGFGDGKPTEALPCGDKWVKAVYHDNGTKTLICKNGHQHTVSLTPSEVQ